MDSSAILSTVFIVMYVAVVLGGILAVLFFILRSIIRSKQREIASIEDLEQRKIIYWGIGAGLFYGILIRAMYFYSPRFGIGKFFSVMSFSLIALTPFVLGFLTVYVASSKRKISFKQMITIPWTASSLCLGAILLLAWEGWICVVLEFPLFLMMASVGGLLAGLFSGKVRNYLGFYSYSIVLIPLVIGPLETGIQAPQIFTNAQSQIVINASKSKVWELIRSVSPIREEEHKFNLVHYMGFPRPIEATLEGEGLGAYRNAVFEGNLIFKETIYEWEPEKKLSFRIKANTEEIPATTLDEHVTIGGPYFDVLNGTYEIVELEPNKTLLKLSSSFRVSTKFNWYSNFWARFIMTDIQDYILEIVKKRGEV